jgi:hypothetical protein
VDNNYLDLGMNKSGFVHTLPSGRLTLTAGFDADTYSRSGGLGSGGHNLVMIDK